MKMQRVVPKPPPNEYSLTFTRDEAWAIVGALASYAESHPEAVERATWAQWARDLDKLVRP